MCVCWIGGAFSLVSGRFIASAKEAENFGVAGRPQV